MVPGLCVIDVENMCIVEYDWRLVAPYFALNYVWGTKYLVTLNKGNAAGLMRMAFRLLGLAMPSFGTAILSGLDSSNLFMK